MVNKNKKVGICMKEISRETFKKFIYYQETGAIWNLSEIFLQTIPFDHKHLVFCCIGTDRSTGDALGPLTGSKLASHTKFPYKVIGTLEHPLHALNLVSTIEDLQQSQVKPYVVAIDACLGNEKQIGQIIVQDSPILPGKAVNKDLPPIGDCSIKGVVNVGGYMEMLVLQSTRLSTTFSISNSISQGLLLAYQRYLLKKKNNYNDDGYYNKIGQVSYPSFR